MKKILSIILVMLMCMSLCACGSKTDKVEKSLQGSWVAEWRVAGNPIGRYYIFKGDTFTTGRVTANGETNKTTGTYEITDSVIQFTSDDGSESKELEYSYNEETGEITLWWNDSIQFVKEK